MGVFKIDKRPYHSPRRAEQAQATRRAILEAARSLFTSRGYGATSLSAIAREAGVAPATVTAIFRTKFAVLDGLIKVNVRGDEDPGPLSERQWWREMLDEPDPFRQLDLYAGNCRRIHGRTTDLFDIVRGAAGADSEIAAMRREMNVRRLQDVLAVAQRLAQRDTLRPGMVEDRATDLLWTLGSAEVYRMLVVDRGWSGEEYERWLAMLLSDSLVRPTGLEPAPPCED